MSPNEVDALLARPTNAIIATNQPSGNHELTPVWFPWDGEMFAFSTKRDRAKSSMEPDARRRRDDAPDHREVCAGGPTGAMSTSSSNSRTDRRGLRIVFSIWRKLSNVCWVAPSISWWSQRFRIPICGTRSTPAGSRCLDIEVAQQLHDARVACLAWNRT